MQFPLLSSASRQQVQAGDLHSSTGHSNDAFRPLSRSYSIFNTPLVSRAGPEMEQVHPDDFDLREEVMSCIAKSIGLLQPPLSGSDSTDASPALPASDRSHSHASQFSSSFSSLSLLDIGDDSSSATGGSSVANTGYMSGLDNEVEILFFAAGTALAKAGEQNTG
jgi:lysophospholipid hydrolase